MNDLLSQIAKYDGLVNEPFSDNDNGRRVEITTENDRWFYLELVDTQFAIVRYMGMRINVEMVSSLHSAPRKRISCTSILAVYNTYGLEPTLLFMKYLITSSKCSLVNVSMYLHVCLLILNRTLNARSGSIVLPSPSLTSALDLERAITSKLREMDDKYPIVTDRNSIVSCTLPIEILFRIVSSRRVCKTISEYILVTRRNSIPLWPELLSLGINCRIDAVHRQVQDNGRYRYIQLQEGGLMLTENADSSYTSSICTRADLSHCGKGGTLMSTNLSVYSFAYAARGCKDINACMRSFLESLRECRLDKIGGWVLQLIRETSSRDKERFENASELRLELNRLIDIALKRDWSSIRY